MCIYIYILSEVLYFKLNNLGVGEESDESSQSKILRYAV